MEYAQEYSAQTTRIMITLNCETYQDKIVKNALHLKRLGVLKLCLRKVRFYGCAYLHPRIGLKHC